ncbi:MAG: hypothetical protein HYV08_08705, partial [Deltaproteobacteria bacterium]|nr:hypothetical protein [Deltaproteobacteria bacterium]
MPPPVFDTVIVNGRLVTPAGLVGAELGIRAGKIAAIGQLPHPPGATILDAQGRTVLPGLVDPHTHPGNYRSFEEEIASETLSAAAGGVTTLIGTVKSTRLGSPYKPYTDSDDVVSYHKVFPPAVAAIQRSASVDVALTPIIMSDEHAREIPEYRREHGITSFKFFVVGHAPTPWSRRIGMPVVVD